MLSERPIRDLVAECMRRERLGLIRPLWADWCAVDNLGGPEQVRLRADHLIRLLATHGVSVVRTGAETAPAATDAAVWRWPLAGTQAERLIRAAAEGQAWEIVRSEAGSETVQMSFALPDAYRLAGRVLTGDREVLKEQGVMSALAAALEVHRVDAAGGRVWES